MHWQTVTQLIKRVKKSDPFGLNNFNDLHPSFGSLLGHPNGSTACSCLPLFVFVLGKM